MPPVCLSSSLTYENLKILLFASYFAFSALVKVAVTIILCGESENVPISEMRGWS